MNLIGRKFQNKSGKVCIVKDFNEDMTIFSDNSKVETRYLLDKKFFVEIPQEFQQINQPTQQNNNYQPQQNFQQQNNQHRDPMDPANFFSKSNSLFEQNFLNQLNSAIGKQPENLDNINYHDSNTNMYDTNVPVMQSDPELEKEEIAKKYGIKNNATTVVNRDDLVNKQTNEFMKDPILAKMLEEEGAIPPANMRQPQQQHSPQQQQNFKEMLLKQDVPESRSDISMSDSVVEKNSNINYNTYIDPIISMFKKAKRNANFKLAIDIEKKIPRLDFIEMMEDSYETSIIDYLAQEFTDSILANPGLIKEKIVAKLTAMLEASQVEKAPKKAKPKVVELAKVESTKPIPKSKTVSKKNVETTKEINKLENKLQNDK